MTRPGYERFVAWRYLRDATPGRWGLWLGLVLLLLAGSAHGYLAFKAREGLDAVFFPPTPLEVALGQVRFALLAVGTMAAVVGSLRRIFTVFTTISIFGVFVGTMALVVVLSVMSGFEGDLKRKILGTYAHVVVSAEDQALSDYQPILEAVRETPGVLAAAPFIENEAMVTSTSNLAGVILRGIDPVAAKGVTDLDKNIKQGSFENLLHPERIKKEEYFKPLTPALRLDGGAGGLPPRPGGADAGSAGPPATATGESPLAGMPPTGPPLPGAPPPGVRPGAPDPGEKDAPARDAADDRAAAKDAPRKDLPGIIIGRELAKNLRLFVGDEVHVVSPQGDIGPTGPIPKSRLFRVAAVFYSGMYEYDTKFVYVTIPVAQKFFRLKGKITGIEVKAPSVDDAEEVAARLRPHLATLPAARKLGNQLKIKPWQELNRNLFSALKLEKAAMFVVLTFIILVASFSIVSNLIMNVMEKGREIAILKSMGATDRSVLGIFVLEGLYIGVIGVGLGMIFGLGICFFLEFKGLALDPEVYYISRLPVAIREGEVVAIAFAALGLSFLATLYPALMAARLRPVEGLRFQ